MKLALLFRAAAVLGLATALSACGDSEEPLTTLIRSTPADAADCPDGGTSVAVGGDANGNGVLEDAEVDSTTAVCGTPPTGIGDLAGYYTCSFSVEVPELSTDLRINYELLIFETNATFITADVAADGQKPVNQVEFNPPQSELRNGIRVVNDVLGGINGGEFTFVFDTEAEQLTLTYQDTELAEALTIESEENQCFDGEFR